MGRLEPGDETELTAVVAEAVAAQTTLALVGAGSKQALGRPVQAAQDLCLVRHAGITLYEPAELVLAAKAGTPLAQIEAELAQQQQQLAFEPADLGPLLGQPAASASLGGMVACNLAGPRRVKAGAVRDHVLGIRAVSGRGELFKTGGRVVKNVTGYDLPKLLTGSHGTLAVLSEITLKVLPRPETVCSLALHGLSDQAALAAMTQAMSSAHEVSGAAHLPAAIAAGLGREAAALTLLRLEGHAPSVAARSQALQAELAAGELLDEAASVPLWAAIRDVSAFIEPAERPVWRLSVPPQAGPAVLAALRRTVPAAAGYYDWAGGLIWLALPASDDAGAALVRAALPAGGGHATLIRAPAALRAAVPVVQPQPAPLAALTARVKASFDPNRVLNPGRMYPGI